MDNKLDRLRKIGFTKVGFWKLDGEELELELADLPDTPNNLYAFAVGGQLAYVGKTVKPLRVRLAGYKKPGATQVTNIKNNKNIKECLKKGKLVDVYVLPDSGLMHYGDFHLNLADALEDSLIEDLEPLWNGGQKEGADQALQPIVPSSPAAHFRAALEALFAKAAEEGITSVTVNSGELHRQVGGYPGSDHRMPVCCRVMQSVMQSGDEIPQQPPSGLGASFSVRYVIPR